ncbi:MULTISPECIES: phosphopantetheine-binding protein [Thalassospira]|jgi:acyl carrier protein|uniref:Acyl carrier protein n=1 Tax=Thalassospira povalilytica TaxID=732237 RepID=A0A8I1MBL4_9PROT|nr:MULTISPECIES: phosphopantetheine-binding protein [Thalassospira]MEE3045702.1 phosphopantetheine-binding protein [Pseudomonadota bacterium]RCK25998.1 acyl carrier protein [Thalassospira profundimaris]KZB70026.1 acyl carrier protein [Thalassospira sp. MCCC 1A02491]MAL40536.1 acyl carrier protein [Thalassospira sp.]MBN8198282.1 acyl carrier protein [Thalassospira povalilytica]|tara:strand:+ start:351 stop:611 length:261 start_codon:yes stop_codon:yes gene_type:complete
MTSLETELKAFIIETLNLEDVQVDDIDSTEALFVDGLGLDSIDALELGVALQKKYDVRIDAKDENVKTHFASVRNLATFIQSEKGA